METIIFAVYGLWFWLTRGYRASHYSEAASTLSSARSYLWRDFANRASTRDRGTLLPHQVEALDILERHSTLACRTSRRFESLSDCCRFINEELTHPHQGLPERRRPDVRPRPQCVVLYLNGQRSHPRRTPPRCCHSRQRPTRRLSRRLRRSRTIPVRVLLP